MYRSIWIFMGCCLLLACKKEEKEAHNSIKAFFSLNDFAEQEAKTKSADHIKIKKTVVMNGNTDYILPDSINWEDELRPLSNNDINKSSWVDKFTKDTTYESGITTIRYASNDKKIPVKTLEVQMDSSGVVLLIRLSSRQENPLLRSSQKIIYRPAFGYRVSGRQKPLIIKENSYSIEAEFLQKK